MSGTMVVLLRAFDVRYLEDDAMTCWHARVRVRVRRFGTCPDMSLALPKCSEYDEKKYIGYQDAFALLVPKLIKIWNKVVIASCNKGWQLHRLVTIKLSQQVWYHVKSCYQSDDNKLVVASWNNSNVIICSQTNCYKPVANTSCWQVVQKRNWLGKLQSLGGEKLRKYIYCFWIVNIGYQFSSLSHKQSALNIYNCL